ncbi:MAG: hypothetical protein ACAI18_15410 [Gemmatimonadales bacterium]
MQHVLAYLVFVGIPLAGLFGVLRIGQGIEAPMAIHGSYAVLPMAPSGFACYAYLLGGDDSTVTVTQSGRQVTVTLGPKAEVTLSGQLSGADLTAEGVIAAGTTPRYVACPVGDTIRMTIQAHREKQVKRLDASLFTAGCPDCAPQGFVAVRPRHYEGRRRS